VKSHPEKCLPDDPETGDLLPFHDHYVLEFLGLDDEHSELQLRKAILRVGCHCWLAQQCELKQESLPEEIESEVNLGGSTGL